MAKNKIHKITVVLKSCLTGKAVWIYQGPSDNAARLAYWRACRMEADRIRRWTETVARRKAGILRLLTELTHGIPSIGELPPEKAKAARQLLSLAEKKMPRRSEFYDHIMEKRRRREEDRLVRLQMRERENAQNRDYDKQGKGGRKTE